MTRKQDGYYEYIWGIGLLGMEFEDLWDTPII
jgi:hypothetical protein